MIFNDTKPMHRLRPQPSLQPLDELRRARSSPAAMLSSLPEPPRSQHPRHQCSRAQLASTHRLRQNQRAQPLAQQRGKLYRIGQWRGEPQHTAGRWHRAMPQAALQRQHPTLTCRKELTELRQQRLEHRKESRMTLQLVDELATAAEARAHLEALLEVAGATDQPIECLQLRGTEAARKTCARQPQRLANGPH